MNTTSKASLTVLVLSHFLAAPAQSKDCVVGTALVCDAGQCMTVPNSILIKVDAQKKSVSRCDEKGCEETPIELSRSGVMTNLFNGDKGYLLRMNELDQSFVEVVTLITAVYLNYGKCLPD